jgi:iron complex outermembrane receptor protein
MIALCAAQILLGGTGTAIAQTPSSTAADGQPVLDEVLVTARKRTESAQSVPLALSALNSEALERVQATDILDIAGLTPNLQINLQLATTDVAAVYLRGFGIGSNEPNVEPAVAVYVDGIYQSTLTGTLTDLFDVEALEVLRGPQGTLLGKNSAAGAISIRTKRPSGEFDGEVAVDYGRFDKFVARGLLNFPIIEGIASGKISAGYKGGGGYYKNLEPGGDKYLGDALIRTVRGGVLIEPSDRISWYVTADYYENNSDQGGIRNISSDVSGGLYQPVPLQCTLLGMCTPNTRRHTTAANYTEEGRIKQYGVTSDANINLGAVTLSALTGYKHYKGINNQDVDGTPATILHALDDTLKNEQFSQELRISSTEGGGADLDGRLDWLFGLYYFDQEFDFDQHLLVFDAPVLQAQAGDVESYALFGHAIYKMTDAWNVSLGVRQTWDRKKHNYRPPGVSERTYEKAKFDELTLELGTEYALDATKKIYARYAQGYRGGGFVGIPSLPDSGVVYDPETVDSYEVGLKSDWLNGRLRANLYGFYNEYKDLQRTTAIPSEAAGFLLVTRNAASATVKGVEFEGRALVSERFEVSANVGYLDASYDKYEADLLGTGEVRDISYFRFPFAPKWTANVGATYSIPLGSLGTMTLMGNYSYRSEHALRITDIPAAEQSGYGIVDGSIRFEDASSKYALTFYGKNLTDKHYLIQMEPNGNLNTLVVDGAPRLWGVEIAAKF